MSTRTAMPIGKQMLVVEKGDIIELITGETATFLQMKRTKWVGVINGKTFNIPIYHNARAMTPYAKALVGKDKAVVSDRTNMSSLKPGQLFALEGRKETYMFLSIDKKGTRTVIKGYDLASKSIFNIDSNFTLIAIDVEKLKKELITK